MKRIDEERCKTAFDDFLHRRIVSVTRDWRNGDEPPDYYLALAGTEYAVEVTTLMSSYQVGNSKLTTRGINSSLAEFVRQVQRLAEDKNVLRGTYLVSFSSPFEGFRAKQGMLSTQLLNYIEHTRDLDVSPQQTIYGSGRRTCRVAKLHTQSDKVVAGLPIVTRWEGEAASEICSLLEERIVTKTKKLGHLEQPKILLLYDAHLFAGPNMFRDCMKHLSRAETMFHTIFVAQEQGGFVLWSENPDWQDE